jgi:uncharacterized protein involved in cysteine biosynthesis
MLRGFVAGVLDAVRGAGYLLRHPRLLKWVIAPALVVTLSALLLFGWVVALVGAVGLVGWTSLAITCAIVIVAIAALVAGPFQERLSEEIEIRETGVRPPPGGAVRFLHEVAISVVHAARGGAVRLVMIGVLLVVGRFVPVVGPAIAAIGSAWVAARFAGYATYDAVWSRRHWSYREKVRYLHTRLWRTLGLGSVVAVMLAVPGVNVLGLAIGSAGATLRMLAEDRELAARGAPKIAGAPGSP